MKVLKKLMAKRCESCPLCRHARNKPNSLFGKVMKLHGAFCPFWKAWKEEYGHRMDD